MVSNEENRMDTPTNFAELSEEELNQLAADTQETADDSGTSETPPVNADESTSEESTEAPVELTLEELKRENELIKKRLEEKDKFIGKQSALVGEYNRLKKLMEENKISPDDIFDDEKRKAYEDYSYQMRSTEEKIRQEAGTIASIELQNKVAEKVPDLQQILPEIQELINQNPGVQADIKLKFSQDPFSVIQNDEDLNALVLFANQARMVKKLKQTEEENERLRTGKHKMLDDLEKKNEKSFKSPTSVPSSSAPKKDAFNVNKPIHEMTDEELDKLKNSE